MDIFLDKNVWIGIFTETPWNEKESNTWKYTYNNREKKIQIERTGFKTFEEMTQDLYKQHERIKGEI
jgi:hypothetical protein